MKTENEGLGVLFHQSKNGVWKKLDVSRRGNLGMGSKEEFFFVTVRMVCEKIR